MNKTIYNHSISIYCPKMDNDGNNLTELVQSVIDSMTIIYGGCTTYNVNGYWHDSNVTYTDNNIICKSFTLSDIQEDTFLHIVERIITIGKQLAVSVEIDNALIIYEK